MKRSALKISTLLLLLLTAVVLFAACGKVEFKVDFIVDDAVYATINTNGEEVIKMPNDPEKEGYLFDGWYWDKDSWKEPFTASSLLDAPLSSNMSVYAKWITEDSVQGTEASFKDFTQLSEFEYALKVANETTTLSLSPLVTINSRSSWSLSSDIYGNQTIASKTATLAIGDNTYYALVTSENGDTQLYTLRIRRRPVYNVIFDVAGGIAVENQQIEEDSFAEEPITTKEGYTLVSWNYDFSQPIVENKIITATWKANSYLITYETVGGDIENSTENVVYDSEFLLAQPTKRGYEFEGWYFDDELVTEGVWKYTEDITLTARWKAINYRIEYDLDGGIFEDANPTEYTVESDTIVLQNPSKPGYIFTGWTSEDNSQPTLQASIEANSIGNRRFTANWTLDGFSIQYHLNGGINNDENPSAYSVESANIYLKNPTRQGYDFGGWYTNADFSAETKITTITNGSTGDIELYAQWLPINYHITYNLGGGEAQANPKTYTIESEDILLNAPTKDGYQFLGWTGTDISGVALNVIISKNSVGDRVYTAVWEAIDYTVVYHLNGGINSADNPKVYTVESPTINLLSPVKDGYVFGGWYSDADFSDEKRVTHIAGGEIEDIELYAKWSAAIYSVRFYKNHVRAVGTMDVQHLTYDIVATLNENAYILEGYTFKGWMLDSDGTFIAYSDGQQVLNLLTTNGSVLNLYAKWEANTYTVTFDKNGGTGGTDSIYVKFDAEMPSAVAPTDISGYSFAGYYDADGNEYYNALMQSVCTWDKAEDTILYARWNGRTYTISFDRQGGNGGSSSVAAVFNQNMPRAISPSKTGYLFGGYYSEPNGLGVQYYDAFMNGMHVWDRSEAATLYAKWTPRSYTVYFNYNGGSGTQNSVTAIYDADMPVIYGVPTRTGYLFAGYFDAPNNGTMYYDADLTSVKSWDKTSSITLYAQWIGINYSVRFDGNGNTSGEMDDQLLTYATAENLTENVFVRRGYTFIGWNMEQDGSGMDYADMESVINLTSEQDGIVILYAQWSANNYTVSLDGTQTSVEVEKEYTVSFNLNGTSGVAPASQIVNNTTGLVYPNVPTRNGYVFGGWYKRVNTIESLKESSGLSISNGIITGIGSCVDTVLYLNRPIASGAFIGNRNIEVVIFGEGVTSIGYQAFGDSGTGCPNLNTVIFLSSNTNVGNDVFGSTWNHSEFKVYVPEDALNWYRNVSCSYWQDYIVDGGRLYVGGIENAGYIEELFDFSAEVTSDITLYAKWISYSGSGVIPYNGSLSVSVVPKGSSTRYYYAFIPLVSGTITIYSDGGLSDTYGYLYSSNKMQLASDDDSGNGNNFKITYSVTAGTLYYVWPAGYNSSGRTTVYITGVQPSAGGKTIGMTERPSIISVNLTYDSEFTLPTDISKVGYTFGGWYDGIGGTGTQYTDAQGNAVRVWDKAENVTLYAKWIPNQYTISFNSNGGSYVDSITQDFATQVAPPTDPIWAEKSFVGWYTDDTLSILYSFTTMPAENITLYAKWVDYEVFITSDETTAISVNDELLAAGTYNATATDTDGNPVSITVTLLGGVQEAGGTVTIRLLARGLYGIETTKTLSNIKVYGLPSITYDTEKDYFNLSDTLNAALWQAGATDTYGETLDIIVSVKEADYKAGDFVTIILSATDVAGNTSIQEIADVKVYGLPVITRNEDINSIKADDEIGNELFGVSAVDSFGEPLSVITELYSGGQEGGRLITVKSSAVDSKGNSHFITYSVKVYDLPVISEANTTSFKVDDEITLSALGISAVDSFGEALTDVTLELIEGVQTAGNTLTFLVTAVDHLGNTQTREINNIRIYGTPVISYDTGKLAISVTDIINDRLFKATAKDSFDAPIDVSVELENGTIAGGNLVTFRLSAMDALGNVCSVVTNSIKVYSADDIELVYKKAASTRIRKISHGEEFEAVATNSFGEACAISIVAADGYVLEGGNIINLYIVATDALGNFVQSELITGIRVYDMPTLSFAREYGYIQKSDSPYALFSLHDSFGTEVTTTITVVSGSLDDETVTYKITGTDRAGNSFEQDYELVVLDIDESILELYKNGEKIGTQRVTKGESFSLPCDIGYYTVWYLNGVAITDNMGSSLSAWANDSNGYIVTAIPVPITYSIQYDMGGGTNSSFNPSAYNIENSTITLSHPTRTGYTFIGWTGTGLAEREMNVVISAGSYGDRTYTAHWQANSYTVSLDANGGEVSVDTLQVTYDATYNLPVPSRTGYTFAGWFADEILYSGGIWRVADDVELIASWTPNTDTVYTVNHYWQNITDDEYTLYETETLRGTTDTSVTPSTEMYTGFTAPQAQTVNVDPDGSRIVNYYYTRNYYTVTVVGNGGTNNTITQKYQSVIDTTNWTTRDGYTLGGLYTDLSLTTLYTDKTMPAENKTVYAYWTGENVASDFEYTSGTNGITITGYTGISTIVKIPEQIGGRDVVAIAASAFANQTNLTSVVVPDSVESIGLGAFKGCDSLESISLPFVGASRDAEVYNGVFEYSDISSGMK